MTENRNAPLGEFWKDGAEGNTPLSAENLNARELKIAEEFKNNNFIIFTWYVEHNSPSTMTYIIPRGTKWSEMATVCPEFWNSRGCYITPDGYIGWSLSTYICEYGYSNNRISPTDEVKQGVVYTSSEQQYN